MMKNPVLYLLLLLSSSFVSLNAQQWNGYTLIATQNSTTASLVDTNGTVYHTWTGLTGQTGYSSYMTPGGVLLRTVNVTNNTFNGGGKTGRFQKVSWTGTILWDVTYSSSSYCMHHDVLPMPNGNVMVIAWESKTASQVTAAGSTNSHTMWPDKIVEFQQTGTNTYNIVWEWHAWDHLMQSANSSNANYVSSLVNNPQLLNINYGNNANQSDWLHMNGLDYNEALDQIVVSSHNMNEFYVIDHSTTTAEAAGHTGGNAGKGGDILYRWGNPATYGASGTTDFNVIHDAHWVPAGCPRAGYLVGFNNSGVSNSQSAVDMVNPPLNGYNYNITAGQAYGPTTYDYRYTSTDHTNNMGNSEQFPNGNMMVCVALSQKVYEVNSAGTTIWTYTASGGIPQAHRYSNCHINGPQTLTASAGTGSICSGEQIQLSATSTGLGTYTYAWSTGATSQNTTATPTSTTTYTVTAQLEAGCSITATVAVNVNTPPTASAGNNVNISQGSSTTLTATGGTSYAWSNGGNTAGISVSPTTTTTYTVTVTDANGCSATASVIVSVSGGALNASATAGSTSICEGSSTQLNASAGGGAGNYTYAWSSNPAGFTSTLQNPTVSPTVNTVYTVTVSDGSATATASVNVDVNANPVASAGSNVSIPFGNSTGLTASGGSSYVWSTGATTASITVSPASSTTYTVTVTNAAGCTASASVLVTVTGGALSVAVSATDTTICDGETTQLFATASGGSGTYTYSWTSAPTGFTSTLSNPYVTPTITTTYIVNVSDGVNSTAGTFTVTVLALPAQPTITQSDTFLVSSSATNNQWYYYGAVLPGDTLQTLDPVLNGSYQVQVIGANGCASPLSEAFEFIQPTGISETELAAMVTLYPNPTSGLLLIKGDVLKDGYTATIYDQPGRVVISGITQNATDVSSVAEGMYVMVIQLHNGNAVKKRFAVSK